MFSRRAVSNSTRAKAWLPSPGGGSGTGPSSGKPETSYPIRLDTRVNALVGVSQLCSNDSLSFASASVRPMIGMTPGRTVRWSGVRPYLARRPFRSR